MILSGKDIEYKMWVDIFIGLFNEMEINPGRHNFRLNGESLVYQPQVPDMGKKDTSKNHHTTAMLLLEPGKLYLGKTLEYTKMNRAMTKT